jgi:hypothetical protein
MTDVQLQSALERLAPQVDERPGWNDVVRRAGGGTRIRWRLAVVAVAMLLTAGVVAGALAEGLLNGTLDRLSAWVGDQPGEPAPEQQADFERENAASYAHFPTGTRVGRLLSFDHDGRSHDLLGFRDSSNLCLRIAPTLYPGTPSRPECVPQSLLALLERPVAIVGSDRTAVYGLAADSVRTVDLLEDGRLLGRSEAKNNSFFISVPREWRSAHDPRAVGDSVVLRAHGTDGLADVPVRNRMRWFFATRPAEDLPGPDRVERTLATGSIGWLERGEPRGQTFEWPYEFPDRVLYSRMLAPDPSSSFRIALAHGEDPDWRENGRWYCLAWLWPTVPGSLSSRGCGREGLIDSGLTWQGVSPIAGAFPHNVGLASDDIGRIEIYYENGSVQRVPLNNNVFSFYVAADLHSKIVAYDHEGRVVSIHLLS